MNFEFVRAGSLRFFPILSFVPILWFQYFEERSHFFLLLTAALPAFISYAWILVRDRDRKSLRFWFAFGLILRIAFMFSDPILSEDAYRFLWDGLLIQEGVSPFAFLPKEFPIEALSPQARKLAVELLQSMNSPQFYSVYPPILQFFFFLSAKAMFVFANVKAGILFWKTILLLSEFGVFWLLYKILINYKIASEKILIYWLNPLVLVEITGNAHPESILVFFFAGTLHLFVRWQNENRIRDLFSASAFFLCGILTKITPLILVPFLFFSIANGKRSFLRRQGLWISGTAIAVFVALAWIGFSFFPELIRKQKTSGLGVFFQLFEFNGSVYYVLREFLRWIGENFYAAGKICGASTLVAISLFSFWKRNEEGPQNVFRTAESVYLIFLIFSTTVHPWYILPLIVCSIFSGNIYPIVWSCLIFVSYSAYSVFPYKDSFFWLSFEYGILFLFLHMDIYEKYRRGTRHSHGTKRPL
ncbi:glycosyltransferase family 39 protein [Leptospira sp. FAT2]|uniref:glycosyltransferase family 39 protein n=1 Tax=Leptospira sanjuanensis TaxID=2879643 RepID=UPI001EE8ADDA|nr:glycosyltransferase family 39 protein [Leptospira sanjuanensis]MCG6193825.1 glycosyltransferase family 39 protein [Leptospira sanjuanensis]